ncbi:MAG: restriction endonuclease subunit S [Flavobacteriales bacterium]|nr:restriction endonuclease subunit S [Flavobacteriales bacterium]
MNLTKPKAWITGNAMVINTDGKQGVLKEFIYYTLSSARLDYLITGSGQPQITGNIREHMIQLPSLEEQSRIAGFLMALDAKVAGVAQAVAAAQKWKKGLLQKMFVYDPRTSSRSDGDPQDRAPSHPGSRRARRDPGWPGPAIFDRPVLRDDVWECGSPSLRDDIQGWTLTLRTPHLSG